MRKCDPSHLALKWGQIQSMNGKNKEIASKLNLALLSISIGKMLWKYRYSRAAYPYEHKYEYWAVTASDIDTWHLTFDISANKIRWFLFL
jgi:hypothetical protein